FKLATLALSSSCFVRSNIALGKVRINSKVLTKYYRNQVSKWRVFNSCQRESNFIQSGNLRLGASN
ncbi:MAG: hypothetical protein V2I33_01035, partial [Kangiellaceae bacterium]|nr:hypothetical protein [Kangiellaceae bacterium]